MPRPLWPVRRQALLGLSLGALLVNGCAGGSDDPSFDPARTLVVDIKPLDGGRLTSRFGWRQRHPMSSGRAFHAGIDWAAPVGTPVRAAAAGEVVAVRSRHGGYGNYLKIDHAGGIETAYAHLSRFSVAPGQRVRRGEIIGRVGRSGWATGPHLHFELHVAGQPIDPLKAASYALAPPITAP